MATNCPNGGAKVSNLCSEDVTHALWSCQESVEVWQNTSLWIVLKTFACGPFLVPFACFLLLEVLCLILISSAQFAWCLLPRTQQVSLRGL